jgi:hypothetical protein
MDYMRDCIKRFASFLILVLAIATVIPAAVEARAPRSKRVYLSIESRYADPGEDPHLRVDPDWSTTNTSSSGTGDALSPDYGTNVSSGGHQAAYLGTGKSYSRVNIKLMVFMRFTIGVFLR